MANELSHSDDIRSFHKSSVWNDVGWILCHPDEIAPGRISSRRPMQGVIRMTYDINLCHPHEITNFIPKASKWLNYCQYLIWMTYGHCSMSPGWLTILIYLIRRTWCHLNPKSSGWVCSRPYLIWMTYSRCIMSSRWLSWRWYSILISFGKFTQHRSGTIVRPNADPDVRRIQLRF